MNKSLALVLSENKLDENKTETLVRAFGEYFEIANKIKEEARTIVVKDGSDKTNMALARTKRLELKQLRVEADKTRKNLKEQSLREGRAIQGVFNVLKAVVVPVEEYLDKQEHFAELLLEKEQTLTETKRKAELLEFITEEDLNKYNVHPVQMNDEVFNQLIKGLQIAKKEQEKAREEEEQNRIEQEEKEEEQKERILKENRELKKQQEVERAKQEKLRAELKKQQEVERKRELLEKQEKEKEKERLLKELQAPDKEKLLALCKTVNEIEFPTLKDQTMFEYLETFKARIQTAIKELKSSLSSGGKK